MAGTSPAMTVKGDPISAESDLQHDPEKWVPVFGKDHAPPISWSGMTIRRKVIPL
jgi:hypothetical protein